MNCKNCGRANPSGSLYCQECGHRLGDWMPPEPSRGRAPTPPTGLARGAVAAPATITCPRCGTANAAHMRFCNNCGFQVGAGPSSAFLATQAASPVGPAPAALAPPAFQPAPPGALSAPVPGAGPPVCWRCRAAGEAGAEFCKFCGARHADDPGRLPSVGAAVASYAANGGVPPPSVQPLLASPMAPSPMGAVVRPASPMAPPASARPLAEGTLAPRAVLVAILKDGSDGRAYPIQEEQTDIGRTEGHLVLGDDPYLSARHARVIFRGGDLVVRDLDSVNGVYVRLREPVELRDGDFILLGQQVLRFEVLSDAELPLGPATLRGVLVFGTPEVPRIARLVQYTTEGVGRDVHYLYRDETVIGREQGDIVCTDDPFMSRRHAAITIDRAQRRFVLRDLGSSNGTAIRIRGERTLRPGDQFRVGRHLFRYDRPGGAETAGGRAGA